MANDDTTLTIKQIAHILGCSRAHVSNLLSGKIGGVSKLEHIRVGRRRLVRREWLDRWIDANKAQ